MTLRAPLYSLPRQRPGPASFTPPNLLEGTLANAGRKPFLQLDQPNPRVPVYPEQTRTWLHRAQTQLIGQDTFFGGKGNAPDYDWPLPRVAPYPISNRTWASTYNWSNLGKDKFFGAPGQAPVFDWPLPRQAYNPPKSWGFAQQLQPLVVQTPFSQTEWPIPRASSYIPQSWAWSLQSTWLQPPFAQSDWPTRAPTYVAQTWAWSAQIQPQPFGQSDWPVRARVYVQQSWTWTQQIQPLQAPFYQNDWPIPQISAYPLSSRTWAWQLLPPLDSAVPFNQTNWELTRGKPLYIAEVTQSLLGLYAPPPAAMPFNQFDWPLPRTALRLWSGVELRNPTLAPPATVAARLRMLMGVGI